MVDNVARLRDELAELRGLSADEARARQDRRLAAILRYHFTNEYNGAYRALLKSHGIEHESDLPRRVDELGRLPTITRAFLQEADYATRPAVPPEQVRKVFETSGTSGNPLRIPATYDAVRRGFGEFCTRGLLLGGLDPAARSYFVVHWVPGGKDVWASHTGTIAVQEIVGEDRLLIASTHTTMPDHWRNFNAHRPAWAMSASAFFLAFMGFAAGQGIDLTTCPFKQIYLGGASCPPEDRRLLAQAYGLEKVHMFYATTESYIPAAELPDESGYVCFEDEILVEVLDYDGRPVAPGERGRVAATVLFNHGFPGIRFLQGDAVTYVGPSSDFPGCKIIADIARVDAGEIGEARLLYSEIEMMPRRLLACGIPVRALQIARRRDGAKDVAIFRVETPVADRERVERAVLDVFLLNPQMKDMLDGRMIHPPRVELYPPGELSRGRFKVPVYVDERDHKDGA